MATNFSLLVQECLPVLCVADAFNVNHTRELPRSNVRRIGGATARQTDRRKSLVVK